MLGNLPPPPYKILPIRNSSLENSKVQQYSNFSVKSKLLRRGQPSNLQYSFCLFLSNLFSLWWTILPGKFSLAYFHFEKRFVSYLVSVFSQLWYKLPKERFPRNLLPNVVFSAENSPCRISLMENPLSTEEFTKQFQPC